jgi:hypothetical protein
MWRRPMQEQDATGAANFLSYQDPATVLEAASLAYMRMQNHAAQLGMAINYATVECVVVDCSGGQYQIQYRAKVGALA